MFLEQIYIWFSPCILHSINVEISSEINVTIKLTFVSEDGAKQIVELNRKIIPDDYYDLCELIGSRIKNVINLENVCTLVFEDDREFKI